MDNSADQCDSHCTAFHILKDLTDLIADRRCGDPLHNLVTDVGNKKHYKGNDAHYLNDSHELKDLLVDYSVLSPFEGIG